MADTNLAADQLKSFVRRIESVEDEINALNADKSEIFKEARSNGFDVKQLRKVIQKRRLPAAERDEQDAVFDLYWDAIHGAPAEGRQSLAHAHVENIEEFPAKSAVAALRADPSMHIVDVANLKNKSEPQSAPQTGSDLTSPSQIPQGQVAPHSDIDQPISNETQPPVSAEQTVTAPEPVAASPAESEAVAISAPLYAAPGEITWETHPPEGVERSPISIAFGNMGQDPVLIEHDLAKGAAQPIVKQGNVIIDGWARYMIARNMVELDGKPLSYPVVQYDGIDPLIDAIRWNVDGRTLDDHQKKLIAATLTRQNPKRKDDIHRAFELWMEPV